MVEAGREGLDRKAGRGRGARALRQPFAGAILMVGMIVSVGSGSVGFGPNAASSGNLALSPQAARNNAIDPAMNDLAVTLTDVSPIVISPGRQPDRSRSRALRDLPDRQAAALRRLRTRS